MTNEPALWSWDTGQWLSCFDSCQLTILWMSYKKDEDLPTHAWDTPPFLLIVSPTLPVQSVDAYVRTLGQSRDNQAKRGWPYSMSMGLCPTRASRAREPRYNSVPVSGSRKGPLVYPFKWLPNLIGEFMRKNYAASLKVVYFDSWSWQSFVSTCDVFNCLFPLDVQNEIYSCYQESSVIHGWFVYWVLVEKCVACQNSVIQFRMASFSFFTLLNA